MHARSNCTRHCVLGELLLQAGGAVIHTRAHRSETLCTRMAEPHATVVQEAPLEVDVFADCVLLDVAINIARQPELRMPRSVNVQPWRLTAARIQFNEQHLPIEQVVRTLTAHTRTLTLQHSAASTSIWFRSSGLSFGCSSPRVCLMPLTRVRSSDSMSGKHRSMAFPSSMRSLSVRNGIPQIARCSW